MQQGLVKNTSGMQLGVADLTDLLAISNLRSDLNPFTQDPWIIGVNSSKLAERCERFFIPSPSSQPPG